MGLDEVVVVAPIGNDFPRFGQAQEHVLKLATLLSEKARRINGLFPESKVTMSEKRNCHQ
jgi:hypothetical protein